MQHVDPHAIARDAQEEVTPTISLVAPGEVLIAVRPDEAAVDAATPVFRLHPDTIQRRVRKVMPN